MIKDYNGNVIPGIVLSGEWESNLAYDSYFYTPIWDEEHKVIRNVLTGTTAMAGGCSVEVDIISKELGVEIEEFMINVVASKLEVKHKQIAAGKKVFVSRPRSKYNGVTGVVHGAPFLDRYNKTVVNLRNATYGNGTLRYIPVSYLSVSEPVDYEKIRVMAMGILASMGIKSFAMIYEKELNQIYHEKCQS